MRKRSEPGAESREPAARKSGRGQGVVVGSGRGGCVNRGSDGFDARDVLLDRLDDVTVQQVVRADE